MARGDGLFHRSAAGRPVLLFHAGEGILIVLSRWQQIGEDKSVSCHDLATRNRDRMAEHRSGIKENMVSGSMSPP